MPQLPHRTLGRDGLRSPRSASAAWACPSSTAAATTPSRSPPSTARSTSASTSSTPPTCTARSPTSSWSAARSRAAATRSSSPPSSATCAREDGSVPRHQRPARVRAQGVRRARSSASASTTSTSTTSTASTARCRSRRPSARWPSWSRAGKVRHLGLSEAAPATIRRAARGAPDHRAADRVLAVDAATPRTRSCRPCRELGIGFVAYSPLGRGFLTGALPHARRPRRPTTTAATRPRFQGENFEKNLELVARVEADRATRRACTPVAARARLGAARRATTSCRSRAPSGASTSRRTSRALDVELTPADDLAEIDEVAPRGVAAGARYHEAGMKTVNG